MKTLTDDDLRREVDGLYTQAIDSGYAPTHIVGIATGGAYIARLLREILQARSGSPIFLDVRCQRQSTHRKRDFKLDRLLRLMPYPVTDRMRTLEHIIRQWRRGNRPSNSGLLVTELNVPATINYTDFRRVLILDDAADTGVTLAEVEAYLRQRCRRDTEIKAAVITKTGTRLLREPDYRRYEGVLVRFPWSFDFHE